MAGEWRDTTLREIAAEPYGLVDGPFGSNLPASVYTSAGTPVIRGSNLSLGTRRFESSDFVYVSRETVDRLARSICRPNDIIFTKKGTIGQTGFVPTDGPSREYLLSSNQMKLSVNPAVADPLFVYYYVSSPASRAKIVQDSEATGVPKTNVTYLRTFPIRLPPLREQQAIACILGALDDKIELNRRMNGTLEAMARAIFQSWFVDFDPVRAKAAGKQPPGLKPDIAALFPDAFEDSELGEIPKGWSIKTLAAICEKPQYGYTASASDEQVGPKFLRITDINKTPWIDWSRVPCCQIMESDYAKYSLVRGDVLIARMADPGHGVVVEEDVEGVFASYLIRFRPGAASFDRYIQYWLRSQSYWDLVRARQAGTTRASLNAQVIGDFPILVPSDHVVAAFKKVVDSLRNRTVASVRESVSLTALRDALLPKLISGDLRVPDAERIVGRCA